MNLIRKHFPQGHILHPIINKNNVKLSYSTTKNIKRILQNHNSKILNTSETEKTEKTCSCPEKRKDKCPLDNKCLSKSLVYKATVSKTKKFYIGSTEGEFKKRLANHKQSFKNEIKRNSTTLSSHIWEVGENPEPDIKWEIVNTVQPRQAGAKECQLCLEEKLQILKNNANNSCLNRRTELAQRCNVFHRAKHKLINII